MQQVGLSVLEMMQRRPDPDTDSPDGNRDRDPPLKVCY